MSIDDETFVSTMELFVIQYEFLKNVLNDV